MSGGHSGDGKQETGGVIINNASVGGLFGTRGGAAYTMAKHALVGLTKNIAGTYGRFGKVRANAIAPGGVATNIKTTITAPDPLGMQALQATGEPPIGQPGQIANLALFLASDEASFINGDIVKADGVGRLTNCIKKDRLVITAGLFDAVNGLVG